jgi:hypothetical protein
MSTREKLEKVLEFIINEENEKASDLLHDVFVEKARGIYEDIATEDDDDLEEAKDEDDKEELDEVGGDIQDEFADEIETDSEMIDQEEVSEEDPDEIGDEMPMDDEMGEEDPIEDAFMNVEDALDELKTEFAQLMGDAEPMDDEMGDEAPVDDMSDMVDAEEEDPLMMGGNDAEPVEEEFDYEQVGEAATMKAVAVSNNVPAGNNKSPVAGKNDMGGKAVNITNDGSEGDHGDVAVKEENAGNVNVPSGTAGKGHSNVPAPKGKEEANNTTSPISGVRIK